MRARSPFWSRSARARSWATASRLRLAGAVRGYEPASVATAPSVSKRLGRSSSSPPSKTPPTEKSSPGSSDSSDLSGATPTSSKSPLTRERSAKGKLTFAPPDTRGGKTLEVIAAGRFHELGQANVLELHAELGGPASYRSRLSEIERCRPARQDPLDGLQLDDVAVPKYVPLEVAERHSANRASGIRATPRKRCQPRPIRRTPSKIPFRFPRPLESRVRPSRRVAAGPTSDSTFTVSSACGSAPSVMVPLERSS